MKPKTVPHALLFICLILGFGLLSIILSACGETVCTHDWLETTVPASCETDGSVTRECRLCGDCQTVTDLPALGHTFGAWETITEASFFDDGEQTRACVTCGIVQNELIPSQTAAIPHVYIIGDLTNVKKDEETVVTVTYSSAETSFTSVATVEVQGSSSEFYPKKNYNVRLYKDETLEKKNKVDLGWGKESKYCLKANWVDSTQARNLVTADLWAEMLDSRDNVPVQLQDAPHGGVVDGFPVIVFNNGEFLGLYTWNIPKDEWMFGIGKSDTGAYLVGDSWADAVKWKGLSTCDGQDYVLKYESEDLEGTIFPRLNEAITFVMNASDEEFAAGIGAYVDVDSAIDYLIMLWTACAEDNVGKNMVLVTFDGLKFYCSYYDMDATWSLYWNGQSFYEAKDVLPYVTTTGGGYISPGFNNELLRRICKSFTPQIVARYTELRAGVLSTEHIVSSFRTFTKSIPAELYAMDWERWPDIPSTKENTVGHISVFLKKRMALLDDVLCSEALSK